MSNDVGYFLERKAGKPKRKANWLEANIGTYEEAELACLKKLIEIVKDEKTNNSSLREEESKT